MTTMNNNTVSMEELALAIWNSLEPCNDGFFVDFEEFGRAVDDKIIFNGRGIYFEPTYTFDEDGNDYGCFEIDLGKESIFINLTKEQNMEWYEASNCNGQSFVVPQIFLLVAERVMEHI